MISLTIKIVPVPKGRPRAAMIANRPSLYTPKTTRDYEKAVADEMRLAMAGKPMMDGPLACAVHVYLPIPQSWSKKRKSAAAARKIMHTGRGDGDNFQKAVWDAATGVLFKDDGQIVWWMGSKQYSDEPHVKINVWRWRCDYETENL